MSRTPPPPPGSLERHMAWLESIGCKPCICRYAWKSLGRLYGYNSGKGWVRMNTDPDCEEHGRGAKRG